MSRRESSSRPFLLATLPLVFLACRSAGDHHEIADQQVYAIVEERRAGFGVGGTPFTIDPPLGSVRERLLSGELTQVGPLDLREALEIAAENSREYQRHKEQLYISALDLTLERYRYQLQQTGTLGALAQDTGLTQEAQFDGSTGFSKLLGTGALLVGSIGMRLFRDIASGDGWDAITDLGFEVTQPLLRGYGQRIVLEPLTQAERNVVYEVRSFERFRRTFAVDVASRLFRVLQQADVVANERENQTNLANLSERNDALAAAGRLSDIDAGQARQNVLSSKDTLIREEQSYESQLDAFKLFLGLPLDAALTLDPMELERLQGEEEAADALSEGTLVAIALRERLDYLTALDSVDDSRRQTEVAADALRAGLGLRVTGNLSSGEGTPFDFDIDDARWTAALDMDLPIDRVKERTAFRATEVRYQASARESVQLGDEIRAALRAEVREREATRESWKIQLGAVELAEQRIESTKLNLEAGRASTRDILEAQEDLVNAQNAATNARVDYHLALLALFRDLEVLRVTENGLELETALLASAEETQP